MRRTLSVILILTVILAMPAGIFAGTTQVEKNRKKTNPVYDSRLRALAYALPKAPDHRPATPQTGRIPLGTAGFSDAMSSPGVIVGYTYYDMQQVGSMGRQVEVGPHSGETGYAKVHFGWAFMEDYTPPGQPIMYAYNYYSSEDGMVPGEWEVLTPGQHGGAVNVDVTPDNRAVVGGHNNNGSGTAPEFHIQWADSWNIWRIPDSVQTYAQNDPNEYAAWPKFFFQFGTDTVFHVVAQISDNDMNGRAIVYFRRVGGETSPQADWEYPPYIVDTVQDIAHDIAGQRTGDRVCMVWFASLPYQEPGCDTCSGISVYDGYLIGQMDNDIYYQESLDQGATWEPRVNMTKMEIGAAGRKAFCDASALYDSMDNLHIVWHSCPWPADLCWDEGGFCWTTEWYPDNARLEHWSENVPYIRPIADQTYEYQTELWDSCNAGAWALRIAKPSISECEGKLYTIWTQFNDPSQGIIDDCAQWGYESGDGFGASNGELYVSVSTDWGMSWDFPRNLTNSYSPRCDPKFGDDCESEYWASMSRYGREIGTGEDWSAAVVVDPSGGTCTGDYYMDIQYIHDLDAGGVVMVEGSWTYNPIKWFRIPCVDPVPCAIFKAEWSYLGLPTYVKPGESLDTVLMLENLGNTELNYSMQIIYDDGSSGWLGTSGFSGMIPSGLMGQEYGTVHLNQTLMTEIGDYYGRIRFESSACNMTGPFDVEIMLCIRDTVPPVRWDSVETNCLSLIVSNSGNMGRQGRGKANMDYYPEDCDSMAQIYMYDGSSIVLGINGSDTVINSAFYGVSPYSESGFYPGINWFSTKECGMYGGVKVFETGSMTAQSFPLIVDKVYVAPQFDCEWILQYMRVRSGDGALHEDVMLGEAIDWDVPWDYRIDDSNHTHGFVNYGGIDPDRNLVYQQGYDAHGAGEDTLYPFNCQYNDNRFAGLAFIESYLNSSLKAEWPHSAFVAENDSLLIYNGFDPGTLYREMTLTGFRGTDSLEDLHSVMCFESAIDINPSDIYEVVTVMATVQNGTLSDLRAAIDDAKAWYEANDGMGLFDSEPGWNIFDCYECCMIMGNFYSPLSGGDYYFTILDIDDFIEWLLRNPGVPPPPDCPEEVDWGGPEGCGFPDGVVNILDLDCMVGHLLRGEYPTPPTCP